MHVSIPITFSAALTLAAATASAHPGLVSSSPKAGEVLDAPPSTIRLSFNEPVEPSFTTVKVTDSSGRELAVAPAQSEGGDSRSVSLRLNAATSGSYRAHWSALGRDGHRIKGDLTFTVK
ncbi:copper resistance CopC family protein [Piscinibacter koreensis]|uniref:Copper resistance protein CopC n=1 Tax=Piscinibacter koreensis TaxID=2742824 RepID=A0A7Y6TZ96_9BURK|nr:copper resistance CopC family protein [Schlegelella koreensis]NUZ08912.1 copper resistance protein CopC [Schlegelella koreensis]